MTKHYICDKETKHTLYGYLDNSKITGFKIKPQNKIKYEGIEVSKMTLLKPSLIERVLKRKTQKRLNAYLNFLMSTIDEEGTDSESLVNVLDDIKWYKSIIISKYAKFLNPLYIKQILLKVKFIEEELNAKIVEEALYMNYSHGGRGR